MLMALKFKAFLGNKLKVYVQKTIEMPEYVTNGRSGLLIAIDREH
jgi:hypothetical protein